VVFFELDFLLLKVFDVVVVGKGLTRHEVYPFFRAAELPDDLDSELGVADREDAVGCHADCERYCEERVGVVKE